MTRKLQQQIDAINAGGPGEKVDKGDKREGDQQEEEPAKRGRNHKKVASVSPKPPAKKKPNRSGLTEHLSQKDLESDIRRMNNILMKHL